MAKIDLDDPETTADFECYFCDFRHRMKILTTRHEKRHYHRQFYQRATKRKEFECDICFTALKSSASLETHKLAHSGEKPFACDECEFKSNQMSNLRTHIKSHHRERVFVQCKVNSKLGDRRTQSTMVCEIYLVSCCR